MMRQGSIEELMGKFLKGESKSLTKIMICDIIY